MVKHPAWAAAISSSGLVPFSFSKRVLKEYGVFASTPESVERFPLPARPVPRQTAFALRIMDCLPAQYCDVDRQISQPFARGRKDRVRNGRNKRCAGPCIVAETYRVIYAAG